MGRRLLRRVEKPILTAYRAIRIALPFFIVAGVVLSFMHQSSLGTLMLIAPTKLSPLWDTNILPLLFLMSAIMVGFPMVILESIYANISFGRKPEMELLTPAGPLHPLVPGRLRRREDRRPRRALEPAGSARRTRAATISLIVEIMVGILAPFLLLLNRAVRRSMGWLFFAVSLIIFGVVLNRINVFLVGYNPPYFVKAYFPSVGEIAMTMAIVSSILFCYRFFVTFFPILPGYVPLTAEQLARMREEREKTVSPFWTWVIRGAAIVFLLVFVVLYSVVHEEAIQATDQDRDGNERVKAASRPEAAQVASASAYPQRPAAYRNFYLLDSDLL